MKKNGIFECTAPNGVVITAVVVSHVTTEYADEEYIILGNHWLCYAQNRLFLCFEWENGGSIEYEKILADYAVLPDYDAMLESYYHMQADSYSSKEL